VIFVNGGAAPFTKITPAERSARGSANRRRGGFLGVFGCRAAGGSQKYLFGQMIIGRRVAILLASGIINQNVQSNRS
jgi:hypothetical protein